MATFHIIDTRTVSSNTPAHGFGDYPERIAAVRSRLKAAEAKADWKKAELEAVKVELAAAKERKWKVNLAAWKLASAKPGCQSLPR